MTTDAGPVNPGAGRTVRRAGLRDRDGTREPL